MDYDFVIYLQFWFAVVVVDFLVTIMVYPRSLQSMLGRDRFIKLQ